MSAPPAPPVLHDVRRGEQPDVLEFIDETGKVLLARAWGVEEHERARTREAMLLLLRPLLERAT